MKPYPKYKDSGVEWIGEVPEGWSVQRLKRIAKIVNGSTPKSNIAEYWDGDIVWVTPTDISKVSSLKISTSEKKITHEGLNNCGASIVPQDSVILTTRAPIGNVAVANTSLCTNQGCKSLVPTNVYSPYLFYTLIVSKDVLQSFGSGTTFKELSTDSLSSFIIALPSQHEQKSIATYLDRKTTQIDKLISKKQKLIELLKEERSAIINQAVTKGLNPDASMKDSGIEWLGEIPAHWEVKRLKYIARITLGKMLTNVDKGGYHYRPYLRAQNINWEKVNVEDVKKMWFSKDELHQYRLNKNDLLVSEGGEVGRTSMWDEEIEECYIQNSVHKVTMKSTNDPFFFLYAFCLFGQKGVFESVASRISIAHLTKEKLKETVFPVPPNDEQERISKFISAETTKVDQTISKIEKQIGLLKEFRTALISEVVTGKIDVRDGGSNG